MSDHGDIRLGDTIDIKFTTRALATGVPTTLGGTPVVSAYVGNSVTQITAGVTLTTDFDGVTGLNNVRVVATSGNGFATATNVQLVITTGTVGGTSVVGEVVGSFSIENRSALRPATSGRNLVVDAAGLADANVVKLGPTGAGTAQTARDVGANVDVATSTRMATYTQPTGFLAATFPGTVASTTNITAAAGVAVSSIGANVITNASIANDAITDAKVAADVTIASVTGAVGSVTAPVAITSNIKQNQALANFSFVMIDTATQLPVAGKTVTVTRKIDAGAFGAGTLSAVTDSASGTYRCDFLAADLNGKVIILRATAAGCDDTLERIVTQP